MDRRKNGRKTNSDKRANTINLRQFCKVKKSHLYIFRKHKKQLKETQKLPKIKKVKIRAFHRLRNFYYKRAFTFKFNAR